MAFTVQDHYFHKAKKDHYLARAIYKLEEIQKKHGVIRSGDRVLDLGAAPGSWIQLASGIVGPSGLVVGIDLKTITHAFPKHVKTFQADIFDQELFERIVRDYLPFDAVLSEGILVIPTFTYSWCKKEPYVSTITECPDMGGYAKDAWKSPRFRRSSNPNFSVAALQNDVNQTIIARLFDVQPTCFGSGSVFDNMYKLSSQRNGYIMLLGGAHNDVVFRTTFIHYVEEKVGVPYRFVKKFYNPSNASESIDNYVRFLTRDEYLRVHKDTSVRYQFPIKDDYTLLGKDLIAAGLLISKPFAYSQTRMVHIGKFCDFLETKIRADKNYCTTKPSPAYTR